MFDKETIRSLPEDLRVKVVHSLIELLSTGIIELQQQVNFAVLLDGGASESDERLAERIKETRQKNAILESLKELAKEYLE